MRVLLAGPDYEENLSIRYLSASLMAAGHETSLAAFNSPADISGIAAAAGDFDMVGLSMCFQSRAKEFLQLAQRIKSRYPDKLVIAGGHYASCAAEALLTHHRELDVIGIHEGEKTLVEIANAMPGLRERLADIPGIAYRDSNGVRFTPSRPMADDLDSLPCPDRRGPIHRIAGVPTSFMMGSRGCYGTCAYCCITTLHRLAPGKRFRQRSVEGIADEMAGLYRERGTRQFVFHDDNFLVPAEAANHARLSALEKALKSRAIADIALVIKCRPVDASLEVLRRLKHLGLVRVFMGVESATTAGLSALQRRQSVEDSIRALGACAELNISAQFTMMVFNPEATLATLRSDLAFMRRFCGNPLNFCRAEIYAGTPLEQRMIELGRARGDYLAREYSLADPAADLACHIAMQLFNDRCWISGSLMQNAIGLDHMAAVRKRFDGPRSEPVCQRVTSWLRSVNRDTINLLEEVLELSTSAGLRTDAGLQRALLDLREREAASRRRFVSEGLELKSELEALPAAGIAGPGLQPLASRLRLATQVAAAILAIGMPAVAATLPAGHQTKAPASVSSADQESLCSLAGKVSDPSGAVIPNANVTILNEDTNLTRTLKTNAEGQYAVNDLPSGRYNVKVEFTGFKTIEKRDIVLTAGAHETANFTLSIGNFGGCCEYAAGPLHVEDPATRKRPFTYYVGEAADHNTLQGIAKVVYGTRKAWLTLYEANRDVIEKPGFIADGTAIEIPRKMRVVPKLVHKVEPAYPAQALKQHISGDVLLDVTLKQDGAVDQVKVIDGAPMLAEAASEAVKQWRYRPRLVSGKPVLNFVVVVSFTKSGKVQ